MWNRLIVMAFRGWMFVVVCVGGCLAFAFPLGAELDPTLAAAPSKLPLWVGSTFLAVTVLSMYFLSKIGAIFRVKGNRHAWLGGGITGVLIYWIWLYPVPRFFDNTNNYGWLTAMLVCSFAALIGVLVSMIFGLVSFQFRALRVWIAQTVSKLEEVGASSAPFEIEGGVPGVAEVNASLERIRLMLGPDMAALTDRSAATAFWLLAAIIEELKVCKSAMEQGAETAGSKEFAAWAAGWIAHFRIQIWAFRVLRRIPVFG